MRYTGDWHQWPPAMTEAVFFTKNNLNNLSKLPICLFTFFHRRLLISQNPPPNFLSGSIWYHIVVFYKNQARQVVIFFLIDRKISSTANFGRTYPRIMCYCGAGQVVALNRMAPVLAWRFSFWLQPITLKTDDFSLAG